MKNNHHIPVAVSRAAAFRSVFRLPALCAAALTLLTAGAQAVPCSWGEFFSFVKTGTGGSAITAPDIITERLVAAIPAR